jgi:hypothetical protein
VQALDNRLIGVRSRLANGKKIWTLIGNVALDNPRLTEHFITFSFEKNGKWFHLGRYFDPTYDKEGPEALAKFLGMPVDDVFPIGYDLRPHVAGGAPTVTGVIPKEPRERLSKDQIMKLMMGKR